MAFSAKVEAPAQNQLHSCFPDRGQGKGASQNELMNAVDAARLDRPVFEIVSLDDESGDRASGRSPPGFKEFLRLPTLSK